MSWRSFVRYWVGMIVVLVSLSFGGAAYGEYQALGKRDPFQPFKPAGPIQESKGLAAFQLDQLEVSGIIWGVAQARAMIVAPDKQGYVVRVGSAMGRDGGRITAITQTGIIVSHSRRDFDGQLVEYDVSLVLAKAKR